ncbi:phage repressor [Legionella busanensis]|uniref:Phage repressor n=1 Tax=Legionella busanensis TaxID=190655 RepID=A0A378JPJ5_9GAMM|nr:hypothetical protein [Legionella busanensis]STX52641.1 phage repressor [Legionella busanensis]
MEKWSPKSKFLRFVYQQVVVRFADEFLTLNDDWPNIKVVEYMEIAIVGKVIQKICTY